MAVVLATATLAASRDGEVVGVDFEAVFRFDYLGQSGEDLAGGFDDGSAVFAYEMPVGQGG